MSDQPELINIVSPSHINGVYSRLDQTNKKGFKPKIKEERDPKKEINHIEGL